MPKVRLIGSTPPGVYESSDIAWPKDGGGTWDASSDLSADAYTIAIDLGTVRRDFSIYGKTSSSGAELYFATSPDNTTWFVLPHKASLLAVTGDGYHFNMNYTNVQSRYIRVYCKAAANDLLLRYTSTRY